MNQATLADQLQTEGYEVSVWNAEPSEMDTEHVHGFETKLMILSGDIAVTIEGTTKNLTAGDTIVIPKDVPHSAITGSNGCVYLIGKKQ